MIRIRSSQMAKCGIKIDLKMRCYQSSTFNNDLLYLLLQLVYFVVTEFLPELFKYGGKKSFARPVILT